MSKLFYALEPYAKNIITFAIYCSQKKKLPERLTLEQPQHVICQAILCVGTMATTNVLKQYRVNGGVNGWMTLSAQQFMEVWNHFDADGMYYDYM